jgi:flavin-dependent dehydrogenase
VEEANVNETPQNELWDAVVIGAGPAGSIAARELARRGRRTLLVDKAAFPRAKVCGGCLNGNALATLESLGLGHVPPGIGGQPISRFEFAARGRRATISLPHGVAVSRAAFDAVLVDQAVSEGVTFRSEVKARLGEIVGSTHRVELVDRHGTHQIEAKVVIAADGLYGHVTGMDGEVVSGRSRIGAGVILSDAPNEYRAGRIHMATSAGGYVGLVRVEHDQLEIAAAFDPEFVRRSGGLGPAAVGVLSDAGLPAIPGLEAVGWKGTPALTRRPARIAGPRWFAVGDAAGYVEPFTGEGMAWAMAGAAAVAEIAHRAISTWSDEYIREWSSAHARIVGKRQWSCSILSRMLRSPLACRWIVAGLAAVPTLASPFVRLLNRPSHTVRGIR